METVLLTLIRAAQGEKALYRIRPLLSREECARAERYVRESDRLLSYGGAWLVRRHYGRDALITRTAQGKPRVKASFFSISHSIDLIGAAFCDTCDVGLDLEKQRDGYDALREYCLSGEEQASGLGFFELFTAKESLAKAVGTGLLPSPAAFPALPLDGPVEFRGRTY